MIQNMTPWLCGLRIQANHVIIKELEIPYQATTRRHCTTHWQVFNPPELGGDLIFDNYHQFLQNSEMTEPPVPVLSKMLNGKLAVSWNNWRQKNQQFYWRLFDWFLDFWRYQNRTGSQMFENHSYYLSGNSYRIFFRTTFIYKCLRPTPRKRQLSMSIPENCPTLVFIPKPLISYKPWGINHDHR